MLSLNKSNDKTVASNDNLNNSSADDDGTASATIEHSDPNLRNGHISVETNSSDIKNMNIQAGLSRATLKINSLLFYFFPS